MEGALSEDARPAEAAKPRRSPARFLITVLLALIAVDLVAYLIFPPFDPQNAEVCSYPVCFINGTLELPAPHVVWPAGHHPDPTQIVTFDVSITSSLVTMWIVSVVILVVFFVLTRGSQLVPHGRQNFAEWVYETVGDFGESIGGPAAKPYIPLFIGFFLFILVSNWSGLIPPIGRVTFLRAPTSDVNVTIGLALVAWLFFELEGFRKLGVGGYLKKFFPFGEFRKGIGAGIIALFVGLVELLLEFVKPVTLSMRLFGNIYGGEVALGVITALTIAIVPIGLYALEVILNLIQALIFSTLVLIFTITAIEVHEEGHDEAESHATPADPGLAPAH